MNPAQRHLYEVTPTLLNSWCYIWECENYVREAESDTVSIEDKIADARKKAFEQFLQDLKRIPKEPTQAMLLGIEFEEECYKGNTCISPIIKGGSYQVARRKVVQVAGLDILMSGRLDVLKGGVIYDIKRVQKYAPQKYLHSYQHKFYMDLFPNAYKFVYLAYDGNKLHQETYYPDECKETTIAIQEFIEWLKENNLLEIYKENWRK